MREVRIALVEDSLTDIVIYKNVINKIEKTEKVSIDLKIFTTLKDVESNFLKSPFDLLISDDHIPGGSSTDVLKFVRKTYNSESLPAIVISGSLNDSSIISSYEAGAQDFWLKQNSPKELQATITKFLNISLADL